jgi:hypothetical protein
MFSSSFAFVLQGKIPEAIITMLVSRNETQVSITVSMYQVYYSS